MYPLQLKPAVKDYLWGGTRLKEEFGKVSELPRIAETWELACHRDGSNVIANGEYRDMALPEYLRRTGNRALGRRGQGFEFFPLLIKLIDARDRLSLQVHPDDAYALSHEHEYGKTEMWYVVDCEPGAKLIYGFKEQLSQEEFRRRIEDQTLLEVCNEVMVKKGDVFFIRAGMLHAIGGGILIAEVQQNSNTTYRVFDYGRTDADGRGRDLHIDQAVAVTDLSQANELNRWGILRAGGDSYSLRLLAECEYFKTAELIVAGDTELIATGESFQSLLVLEGNGLLDYDGGELKLRKGSSVFIPAGMGRYRISGSCNILFSQI